MKLSNLLTKFEHTCLKGSVDTEVSHLVYDSRKVEKGDVFVCIKGAVRDSHDFARDAAQKGASAIVAEKDLSEELKGLPVTLIVTEDTRQALACMSCDYFANPAQKLITIGITGTVGKTTTTYMVKAILEEAGIPTGLIGTNETIIGDKHIPASNTTPESYVIQESFAQMAEAGLKCVVMEVSSQGLKLKRTAGFTFDYGIFTNLSEDHIGPNEHRDFAEYLNCKALLFKQCRTGIVNADDPYTEDILKGSTCKVETYGLKNPADYKASGLRLFKKPGVLGITYDLTGKADMKIEVDIPGRFSVYNSLTAIAICLHFTDDLSLIEEAMKKVQVQGRVEIVPSGKDFTVIIDYAHNAKSLESLLLTLKEYEPLRLITVFGCGGNRSKVRRFEMGEVSSRLSDLTIVTSDNPRFEEPMDIINDILTGVKKADGAFVTIPDRKEAIEYALDNARTGDIIIIAGKGHEDYQEIKGVKHHFSDREVIEKHLIDQKTL